MIAAALAAPTLAAILCTGTASAQTTAARTFVSGLGSDSNPCTRAAPCRSFVQAISVTSAGGEIVALDSAGYGPFTITKAISVTAQGVEAAITTTSGDGITINAGASDVINLRALTLTGTSSTSNGITFNSGGTLNIQNCVARGFGNDGIYLAPTNTANVNISDTIVSNNGQDGVGIGGASGAVNAFIDRLQAVGNGGDGVFASSNSSAIHAIVVNSVLFGNLNGSGNSGNSTLMVVDSKSNANNGGFKNSSTTILAHSAGYANPGNGFVNTGSLKTFGNSDFAKNGPNSGSLTPIAQQ